VDPESRGSVDHVTCLRELVGEMKEGRKHLIHQVPTHVQYHTGADVALLSLVVTVHMFRQS